MSAQLMDADAMVDLLDKVENLRVGAKRRSRVAEANEKAAAEKSGSNDHLQFLMKVREHSTAATELYFGESID